MISNSSRDKKVEKELKDKKQLMLTLFHLLLAMWPSMSILPIHNYEQSGYNPWISHSSSSDRSSKLK